MIRSILRRFRLPLLVFACTSCASSQLTPAQQEKLTAEALKAAMKFCAGYHGSDRAIQETCFGLAMGTKAAADATTGAAGSAGE